ncbi:MAG TPA: undecaprenyldiphospho-muramoylpentapeptide beta-N-acetylglucosaminyltransferase [Bryobacteraceae bacterium]|nr:undecaprenyldiphospho-muramoylpentapeptide beta-N-acetylglucosaminyltransferase [Bryobacteraceae bacterium]
MNLATFVMAGGGTGGHVIPLLAVARELRSRGHAAVFIGTRRGLEAKLVGEENFPIEFIEIGGLNRVGARRALATLSELPFSIWQVSRMLDQSRPAAIFSMGGYVAGPVLLAALWKKIPVVVMEPNAMPGFTHRKLARFVSRALVGFEETARWFPPGRTEITGLPVRDEFFAIKPKTRGGVLNVLITGGSQGSRTLNRAAEQSWQMWKIPVRLVHQTGPAAFEEIAARFRASGIAGEVIPFITAMPEAFAQADIVVSRAGAGTLSEIAAAGKPSILVPLATAADQHQLRNAEAFEKAGAARLVPDSEMTGERLVAEVTRLVEAGLDRTAQAARSLAHAGAARRAAEVLESFLNH